MWRGKEPNFLKSGDVQTRTTVTARVGQLADFGFVFDTQPGVRLRFVRVEIEGVPRQLRVVKVWADRLGPGQEAALGAELGDLPTNAPEQYKAEPISSITLIGGTAPNWQVIVTASAAKVGLFHTAGLAVTYEVDGKRFSQRFPYAIEIRSITCKRPNESQACAATADESLISE